MKKVDLFLPNKSGGWERIKEGIVCEDHDGRFYRAGDVETLRSELDSMMGSNESLRIDNELLRSELEQAYKGNESLRQQLNTALNERDRAEANYEEMGELAQQYLSRAEQAEATLKTERIAGMEEVLKIVKYGADEGPVYCKEPACIEAAIRKAIDAVKKVVKCDGNHGGPRCGDPECWNQ